MAILTSIVTIILLLAIILVGYLICKKYVFSKIRINKFIPLGISIVVFLLQIYFGKKNIYLNYALSAIAVLFFLWFMDIMQTGGPKKKQKEIKIRPKAKPNRVKNKDK